MERIGREVERELARRTGSDHAALDAVTDAWPETVGPAIARQAWPSRIARDGTLHVATSSATWAHELAFHAEEILVRIRDRLGPLSPTAIRCAPGPVPEPAGGVETEVAPPALTVEEVPPEVRSEAAALASTIDDPELRELVARAARASLLRARSGRTF